MDINEVLETYNKTQSLRETAAICGINWQKVRKMLITHGAWESDVSIKIQEMYKSGQSVDSIATNLCMSIAAVNGYLPYKKGIYNLSNPSVNADRIRKLRAKLDKAESSE